MNSSIKKALSIILILTMLLCLCSCTKKSDSKEEETTAEVLEEENRTEYNTAAEKVTKTETVYVNMDSKGNTKTITVSDWLHTDKGGVYVLDRSDLSDIVNVKGTEKPLINGNEVRWDMASTDLYYRGYSDKELPVDFDVTYSINGAEVEPSVLEETSGKVNISFKVTNKSTKTVEINGKQETISEPIVVIGGMILNEEQFSAIETVNGKTIGDGSKEIAVFISMPGLSESLGFSEADLKKLREGVLSGIDLSGNFSISMDATGFSLGNMYFVAAPISAFESSLNLDDTLSEVSGLLNSVKGIADTVYSMGADELIKNLMTNSDKIADFAEAFNDARQVYNENKVLIDALKGYLTPENLQAIKTIAADIKSIDVAAYYNELSDEEVQKVLAGLSETDLSKYQQLLSNPLLSTFFKDLSSIGSDVETLEPLLEMAAEDEEAFAKLIGDIEALMPVISSIGTALSTPEAQAAIEKLPASMAKLQSIATVLSENSALLEQLANVFSEENIKALTDALDESDDINVNELMESISGMTSNPDETLGRLKAINDFAKESSVYTMAGDGMEAGTMYIFRTDSIG